MFSAPLLLALAAPHARAATIVRGPYLEGLSAGSGYVCWRTDIPTEGSLAWRPRPGGRETVVTDAEPKRQRCLEAKGLAAGARYEYRLRVRERGGPVVWTSTHSFRSPSGPDAAVRFAVFGDSGRATKAQFEVAARVREADPEFVLLTGDVIYEYGEDSGYDARYFAPYAGLLDHLPAYIGIGNHDYANLTRDAARGRTWLKDNYFTIHHNPSGTAPERTFYSFDWGPGHFVALDSNAGYPIAAAPSVERGSEQLEWLERDLAASKAPWKIIFLHVAVYSSGGHATNELLTRTLAPVFEKHKVDVVFQGHDHDYERTAPIKAGRRAPTGPVYVVAGIGGAPVYPRQHSNEWTEAFARVHGFIDVRLEPGRLRARGVADDGSVFDSFELRKASRP